MPQTVFLQSPLHASECRARSAQVQGWAVRGLDLLFAWQERAAGRRQLAALDERMLHDIGVNSAAAAAEAAKPFWNR